MNQLYGLLANPYFLGALILWSLIWKGTALWRAARLGHLSWFIALLVINTAGIFEIIYILFTRQAYREKFV